MAAATPLRRRCAINRPSAVLALLVALLAAPPTATSQPPSFGGVENVVAVEIPVQVLVDGRPVSGLTADNFEVLDGRKPSRIVGFEEVNLAVAQTPSGRAAAVEVSASTAGRRHFLLLFDLTNSEAQAISRARAAARNLVRDSLHPHDLVAVATWSSRRGARQLVGFTSDRRQVAYAIDSLGLVEINDRTPDPAGLLYSELPAVDVESDGSAGRGAGNIADEVFLEALNDVARAERSQAREAKERQLKSLTEGFSALARLMSNLSGRKYVVLLSQGFDASLVTGTADIERQNALAESAQFGEVWNVDSDERFGSTRSTNQLEGMLEEFRRADCIVQAVDIGGLATDVAANNQPRTSNRASLATLAKDTGGQLYENFNDLGLAMGKMLEATSVTYVLTIQPEALKPDGKFRPLKVKLQGGPAKARLVHRLGYYAPRPFAERSGGERQMETAALLLSGITGGQVDAAMSVAALRGAPGSERVAVVLSAQGPSLLAQKGAEAIPMSVAIYAFDAAGNVADFVGQAMQLERAKLGERLSREPLKYVADLRLRPGTYRVRALVRAGEAGAYWIGTANLDVPDFSSGGLAASEIVFPEPMTTGIVVRSSTSAEKTRGLPFPFTRGDGFYLPAAPASVHTGGEVEARWHVYGLNPGEARVMGEWIDARGSVRGEAAIEVVSRATDAANGFDVIELRVASGGVEAGEYTLRVRLEQGDLRLEERTTLRVVG